MLRGPVRYANDGMLLQAECESVQDDLRLSLIVHSCVNCTSNGCPIYNTGGYFISFLGRFSSPIFRPVSDGFAWTKAPFLYFISWQTVSHCWSFATWLQWKVAKQHGLCSGTKPIAYGRDAAFQWKDIKQNDVALNSVVIHYPLGRNWYIPLAWAHCG